MHKVRLIHWNRDEARNKAAIIEELGYEVRYELPCGAKLLRQIKEDLPEAFAIVLDRLPAQGRDLGLFLRKTKATRYVPLVFIGGAEAKVEPVRKLLPDAVYSSWNNLRESLARAIAVPPTRPVTPDSVFAAYAGKPLVEKLAIQAGSRVGLLGEPEGFAQVLTKLPEGVELVPEARDGCDQVIWFVRSRAELERGIDWIANREDYRSVWIAWPKQSSKSKCDLTQQIVRRVGMATGLVDYKICSIDAIWSGLLFTRRG